MTSGQDFAGAQTGSEADYLSSLLDRSDRILIKKLSNNDRDWARYSNKHQAGVYIPQEHRDGGFFLPLDIKPRTDPNADEIRERFFATRWPQVDNAEKRSRLVHYTSKGQETHLTGVPKPAFSDLLPASFLVMGRIRTNGEFTYDCLTIDSGSEEADLVRDVFELDADFLIQEFDPASLRARERDRVIDFVDQVIKAWLAGKIALFAKADAAMPPTAELAYRAQAEFLKRRAIGKIDPFSLEAPGDALRVISRDIEWNLFREFQRRERSVELVRIVLGDDARSVDVSEVIRQLIDKLAEIDALMLSASQQRKARAGYSYEHHIEAMLTGGDIPFEKQVVLESKKRPDFVLPSLKLVDGGSELAATGFILSAKTTLRERWKQVEREKRNRRLFLTTVDENIAASAIEDMADMGVKLVIPESLMKSNAAEYENHSNVLTFRQLCDEQIRPHLSDWTSPH